MNRGKYREELIFYGDDIRIERFPPETLFLYANQPLAPVDPHEAISKALDEPLQAEPLEKQLTASSRVTIAFDDPCLPIPLMRNDVRGMVIEELLRRLSSIGIPRERIRLICANGLHRKWTLGELELILGKRVIAEMGSRGIICHDATRDENLVFLGSTDTGLEVEINRAVAESDVTIYVNLNFTSMNGGWKSILVGLGSYRSIRHHHTPEHWNGYHSILDPERSPMHHAIQKMGELVEKKHNIFQIESVVNNQIWPHHLRNLLTPLGMSDRDTGSLMQKFLPVAAYAPRRLKRIVRNALRSDYRLCSIAAGSVEAVHRKTLEILFRQQNVQVDGPADILILGVPNLSPYSALSEFNPILLRHLILGYLRELYRNRSLVREGGIIIACNPGVEVFHHRHHPSYRDFWERDAEAYADPEHCWNELAEPYANNSEYLKRYRDDYAYHGTHPLMLWMWSGMGLRRVRGVILAGSREPDTARRLGFTPAGDLKRAIAMAREIAGKDATIVYQVIPPLFCVDVP